MGGGFGEPLRPSFASFLRGWAHLRLRGRAAAREPKRTGGS